MCPGACLCVCGVYPVAVCAITFGVELIQQLRELFEIFQVDVEKLLQTGPLDFDGNLRAVQVCSVNLRGDSGRVTGRIEIRVGVMVRRFGAGRQKRAGVGFGIGWGKRPRKRL